MRRWLIVLILLMVVPGAASARHWRYWHEPYPYEPCGGPYQGPCITEIPFPFGETLQLTVQSVPADADRAKYQKSDHDLDTIGDLFAELRSCWSPPGDITRQGMQMTVRFSLNKAGRLIGPPRMTYATAGVSGDVRTSYLNAITASLNACLPLKFTRAFGDALAGRPIAIRYVDNRDLGQ